MAQDGFEVDRQARIAWRGAMMAALLNAFGAPLELLVAHDVTDMPRWPPLAAGAVGALLLLLLALFRHRPTRLGAATAFTVNTASILGMLWIVDMHWATLGPQWAAFQENKLGAITVALLTPELVVGIGNIVAYAGSAVAFWLWLPPALRAQVVHGEPWATCIFAAFGLALLVVNARRFVLERRLVEEQQEAASFQRLARVLLAVREFANTPLQTITCIAGVIRLRHPAASREVAAIDRALERMRELNAILSQHADSVRWTAEDTAFDAAERLRSTTPDRPA
jgi:hypothetical protein